ncbi:hypothetical protein EV421DRAFT_1900874 [Armillaria borealis]|uniref:Uncharacterized protein n=1 Tax=Armillaria borealis TaxID=47425 RepID=A0AA39JSQ7_9AGAR|nr:hypothetical protein EV421DRAFT_1900874 [Armillaria borealis]
MADSSPFQSLARDTGSVKDHPEGMLFFNGGPLDSQLSDGEYVRQLGLTTPTHKVVGTKSSPISIASTPSLPGGQAEAYERFGSEVVPLKWPSLDNPHASPVNTPLAVHLAPAHTKPAMDVDLTPIELDVLHCFRRYVAHERDELNRQLMEDRDTWRNLYSELAQREVVQRRNMLRMATEMETMSRMLKQYGVFVPDDANDGQLNVNPK